MAGAPLQSAGGGGQTNTSVITTGAITRAVRQMSVGSLQDWDTMREREWTVAPDEIDQQMRIAFTANVGEIMEFTKELKIMFPAPFIDAPEERLTPFGEPHFTYGVHIPKGLALVTVLLVDYLRRDQDYIVGANVRIGVVVPGPPTPPGQKPTRTKVTGTVHLNFQGFGVVQEDDPDAEEIFGNGG